MICFGRFIFGTTTKINKSEVVNPDRLIEDSSCPCFFILRIYQPSHNVNNQINIRLISMILSTAKEDVCMN